jgi:hypothetical protein
MENESRGLQARCGGSQAGTHMHAIAVTNSHTFKKTRPVLRRARRSADSLSHGTPQGRSGYSHALRFGASGRTISGSSAPSSWRSARSAAAHPSREMSAECIRRRGRRRGHVAPEGKDTHRVAAGLMRQLQCLGRFSLGHLRQSALPARGAYGGKSPIPA